MGYYFNKFDILSATTSTGAGTPTKVQGYGTLYFQVFGRSIPALPATSTIIFAETRVHEAFPWVQTTVTDMNSNVATNTVATDSVFRITDTGGIVDFRLRVATFNGIGASISAVGCSYGPC
jgi:hypothetical protein